MATKPRITGKTHASAVSKQLRRLGYNPYGAHETRYGGYVVRGWKDHLDTEGGQIVQVGYEGVQRELKPTMSRKATEREKARLERMADMAEDLRTTGYFVAWGWNEKGEQDASFLAVSGSPARPVDIPEEEEVVVPQETVQEPEEAPQDAPPPPVTAPRPGAFPFVPLVTPEDTEDLVRTIREAATTDPEAARRMEAHLYYLVLVAVVSGVEDAADVAATALQTQGILLPR